MDKASLRTDREETVDTPLTTRLMSCRNKCYVLRTSSRYSSSVAYSQVHRSIAKNSSEPAGGHPPIGTCRAERRSNCCLRLMGGRDETQQVLNAKSRSLYVLAFAAKRLHVSLQPHPPHPKTPAVISLNFRSYSSHTEKSSRKLARLPALGSPFCHRCATFSVRSTALAE